MEAAAATRMQSVARGLATRKWFGVEIAAWRVEQERLNAERQKLDDAERAAREEEERLAALRRSGEEADEARRRAEEEAERLRREMDLARTRAAEEAETRRLAELEAAERRRQQELDAERREREVEQKRLLAAAQRGVRALQPTALTYIVVSYVFPEDVVRVSYVSGPKQWVAWEIPFV